ncbi:hypothetical protein [Methylobacterium nodulans]|uniref:Porin n=1 Tax=Methylobacterium nodulans (strain LMG 21967 / CNCM I-2342 / ORS 2060) TaxID=460265 RepID=B8IAZ7_METNO|nr:hypothetical protein [Methylobacterium nodulans]ACL55390.1 hypothetical protein Mnod_0347 [Methylobacterium nodulans ORS 2060]
MSKLFAKRRFLGAAASCVLGLAAGAARAEDFTGFYAGVNVGYGRSLGDGDGRMTRPGALPSPAGDATALPPSAARAATGNPALRPRGRGPTISASSGARP